MHNRDGIGIDMSIGVVVVVVVVGTGMSHDHMHSRFDVDGSMLACRDVGACTRADSFLALQAMMKCFRR